MLGAKGLRGALRIEVLTDWPERLVTGASVYLDGDDVPLLITGTESGGRVPVVHLDRVTSREEAEAVAGRYLEAEPPPLDEGTYFWEDLVGLRVEDAAGAEVGELVEVFRAGGNEVYRIVGPRGERLVPALRATVSSIDLERGVMVVADDDAEEVR